MTNLAVVSDKVPAYLKGTLEGVGRGNEHVGQETITPRIKLIQTVSPEFDKNDPKYVKGVESGDFYNALTGSIYGNSIKVLSLLMRPLYWATQDFGTGGGMGPKVDNRTEAENWAKEQINPDLWKVTEVHEHVLLILNEETGEPETSPALMDFNGSKLAASKAWNSKILMQGGDRFASVWDLHSKSMVAKKSNKTYETVELSLVGWAKEEHYKLASDMYDQYTRNR
tara:strand:+ start:2192 stop:2869 length:678 start_codon:yes stop_codon:yes gene_type:complete